ncbi:RVT 1 domain containing protein [Asbolus verrucosus]|uniref:RVT 1 domain containing protein n=1 Tax=Asbolus verrucosus TaxID=1661398 RepID=A0A482WCR7_ASBVE|nr:RVT 1 domain containing protein [Asbolus verrucosus]
MTDKEKAEMLAEHYQTIHKKDDTYTTQHTDIEKQVTNFINSPTIINEKYTKNMTTSLTEIVNIIKKLKTNKAPGLDKIENKVIKNMSKKSLIQLTNIINAIFKFNHYPTQFKTSKVIPIHKTGKNPQSPNSYRPISLPSILAKVTEKIIHNRLEKILRAKNIKLDTQFGFKKHHNTVQQLIRIVNDISINFNKDNNTVMTLYDIEKAFDKVWVEGLIYKMIKYGIEPNFIKLIYSYLTDRKIIVQVGNSQSKARRTEREVPQGSVLGPALFSLFITDITHFPKTKMALYADDTAIYAHSHSAQVACKQIQIHTNMLEQYYKKWKIQLNNDKTEQIVFSKKFTNVKILDKLKVGGNKIVESKQVKYLGTYLDSRLNYNENTKQLIKKGSGVLKNLYSLLSKRSKLKTKNKIHIYKAIIRPVITYAAPVWCGLSDTAIKPLEVFQNKCMRLILNESRYARVAQMRERAEIQSIKEYVRDVSNKFYTDQLKYNKLTKQITKITSTNTPFRIKHKLPHQTLKIFQRPG